MLSFSQRSKVAIQRAAGARDKQTLCQILDQMAGPDGRVLRPRTALFLGTAAVIGLAAYLLASYVHVYVTIGLVAGAVLAAGVALYESRMRSGFVEAVLRHASFLDHQLTPVKVDGRALWKEWKEEFPDFHRGDKGQEIDRVVQGHWQSKDGRQHPFSCYRFTYVEETESSTTDGDGKTKTETTDTTYYRYGIVGRLPVAAGVAISGARTPKLARAWTTSSIAFNKKLKCAAQTEMQAAKLLTPTMVERLTALAGEFRQLDIHMPGDRVCFSFDDADLLARSDASDKSDRIDDLKSRIQQHASLPRLQQIQSFLAAVDEIIGLAKSSSAQPSSFAVQAA